jgi:hypothetical protein
MHILDLRYIIVSKSNIDTASHRSTGVKSSMSVILKWTVSYGRRQEILSSKYVCLIGHIPVTKNTDLMFFGVSAFRSDLFTMDGMSHIVIVFPGWLLNHESDALFTNFLKGP